MPVVNRGTPANGNREPAGVILDPNVDAVRRTGIPMVSDGGRVPEVARSERMPRSPALRHRTLKGRLPNGLLQTGRRVAAEILNEPREVHPLIDEPCVPQRADEPALARGQVRYVQRHFDVAPQFGPFDLEAIR